MLGRPVRHLVGFVVEFVGEHGAGIHAFAVRQIKPIGFSARGVKRLAVWA